MLKGLHEMFGVSSCNAHVSWHPESHGSDRQAMGQEKSSTPTYLLPTEGQHKHGIHGMNRDELGLRMKKASFIGYLHSPRVGRKASDRLPNILDAQPSNKRWASHIHSTSRFWVGSAKSCPQPTPVLWAWYNTAPQSINTYQRLRASSDSIPTSSSQVST